MCCEPLVHSISRFVTSAHGGRGGKLIMGENINSTKLCAVPGVRWLVRSGSLLDYC